MPLAFIAPGKLSPTDVTGEGLLPCVGADVGGEVVTAAEVAQRKTIEWERQRSLPEN